MPVSDLPIADQLALLRRGAHEIIPEADLEAKLTVSQKTGKPLRVKLGCDPTRPDLHLGHAVVLRKLRQFQDLGHQAILLIGDFTGMIGDPSGRNKTRPPLTLAETRVNAESYLAQATTILDGERTEIVYNGSWLGKFSFEDVIRLSSRYTVARMLERDDFTKRYSGGIPISLHELLYPLAQAYDSVALEADVELGGTDQKFNLLVGRDIQREYGQPPQVTLTVPILRGTDGVEKMSKSLDNYIGLTDAPAEMYGKTLSIPDELIAEWFLLCTDLPSADLAAIDHELAEPGTNPRNLKRRLAREIVAIYHGAESAAEAEADFDRKFIQKQFPDDAPVSTLPADERPSIPDFLVATGLAASKGEARRLMDGGGVQIDGVKLAPFAELTDGRVPEGAFRLQVGKRKFLRVERA